MQTAREQQPRSGRGRRAVPGPAAPSGGGALQHGQAVRPLEGRKLESGQLVRQSFGVSFFTLPCLKIRKRYACLAKKFRLRSEPAA